MKKDIKPIKQETEFGCLSACYRMIRAYFEDGVYEKEDETQLTSKAFSSETGFNEHFYLKKLSSSGYKIKVIVETPYMLEGYTQLNTKLNCNIPVEFNLVGNHDFTKLLDEGYLIITLIDLWSIDMIIHYPHYVIVENFEDDSFMIADPKYCKKIKFSRRRFEKSLEELKYRLGYSPLIFAIKKD